MSFSHIAELYRSGGWVMHLILGIAVAIFGLTLERAWVVFRASSWNFGKLKSDLIKQIGRGDIAGAAEICRNVKSPVTQVAGAILASNGRTEDELFAAADAEATLVMPAISRRLAYFALLANVATLMGLLGTIFGLITAFSAVGAADPSQRSQFLAKGISEAMNATAFGLLVAVPGLLIHGFFVSRVERIGERLDEMTVTISRAVSAARQRDHAAPAPAARPAPAQNPMGIATAPSVSVAAAHGQAAPGAQRLPVRNR